MKIIFSICYLFLFITNLNADTSIIDLYLKKIKQNEINTTPPPTVELPTPVQKTLDPVPTEENKTVLKNENIFSIDLKQTFKFFTINSTATNTNTKANISSKVCPEYSTLLSYNFKNFKFGFMYSLERINIEDTPTGSNIYLQNKKQSIQTFGSQLNFKSIQNEFTFTIGITPNLYLRSYSAHNISIDKISSPFFELDYQYNFRANEQITISPNLGFQTIFKSQNSLYNTDLGIKGKVGIKSVAQFQKFYIGLETNYSYKKQKSDFAKDIEQTLSTGISVKYDF